MWTSKIDAVGRPLVLALKGDGSLLDFSLLVSPVLNLRLRNQPAATALSRTVTAYTAEPTLYNAQVVFSDFTGIVPGVYLCEVQTTLAGNVIMFPDGGYFLIRFLSGVD